MLTRSLNGSNSMAYIGGFLHSSRSTNAILLPYVIRYNGTRPTKASYRQIQPTLQMKKFRDIVRMLGLPSSTLRKQ